MRSESGIAAGLWSGRLILHKTDLSVFDVMPINITRTYRADDPNIRAFGIGADLPFNWFFYSTNAWHETDVILHDGQRIRYNCRAERGKGRGEKGSGVFS
jgi:hypothetical protein